MCHVRRLRIKITTRTSTQLNGIISALMNFELTFTVLLSQVGSGRR